MRTILIFLTTVFSAFSCLHPASSFAQTAGLDQSILLSAEANRNPDHILIRWQYTENLPEFFQIRRKLKEENAFQIMVNSISTFPVRTWIDSNVVVGATYEYEVVSLSDGRYGIISAGIDAISDEFPGRVLLVVDSVQIRGASFGPAVRRWTLDVQSEGWEVERLVINQGMTPVQVKQQMRQIYNERPYRTSMLFGSIPIPFVGPLDPDGHGSRFWPSDAYYADIDRNYTLESGFSDRFRMQSLSSPAEIEIGRVDLRNTPAFIIVPNALLMRYLSKNHRFRKGIIKVRNRGAVWDQTTGLPFSASAWQVFPTLVTDFGNLTTPRHGLTNSNVFNFILKTSDYMWSASWGYGTNTNVGQVYSTNYVNDSVRTVFTGFFGSYFGDWANGGPNNLLKCALGSRGPILAACYNGSPIWSFQSMGLGETIGYSAKMTINKPRMTDFGHPLASSLLGDPTIRMYPMDSLRNLRALQQGDAIRISWNTIQDNSMLGYHIYKRPFGANKFYRINRAIVAQNEFYDSCISSGRSVYLVRPVKRQISRTGTFINIGGGTFDSLIVSGNYPNRSPATISISSNVGASIPCFGTTVTLQVQVANFAGPSVYTWINNNQVMATTQSPSYSFVLVHDVNQIRCKVTSPAACNLPVELVSDILNIQAQSSALGVVANVQAIGSNLCPRRPLTVRCLLPQFDTTKVLSFKWFVNTALVSTSSFSRLTRTYLPGDSLRARVVFINNCGQIDSVISANHIRIPPFANIQVNLNVPAIICANATNVAITSNVQSVGGIFRWFSNFSIPNSSSRNITLPIVHAGQWVRLAFIPSASVCSASDTIWSVQSYLPVIATAPMVAGIHFDSMRCSNQQVRLVARSPYISPTSQYTWFKNNSLVSNQPNDSVYVTNGSSADVFKVRVRTISNCMSPDTASSINVTAFRPMFFPTVQIAGNTENWTACAGDTLVFNSLTNHNEFEPQWQWFRNNSPVAGATGAQWKVANLDSADRIYVELSSTTPCSASPRTSSSEVVARINRTFSPEINITGTSNDWSICRGDSVVFRTINNHYPEIPIYNWFLNGNIVSGATASQWVMSNPDSGDRVYVRMASTMPCSRPSAVISNMAEVIVHPQRNSTIRFENGFLVSTASQGQNFIWHLNGDSVAGANGSTFLVVQPGTYFLVFTNQFGCSDTSNHILVTSSKIKPGSRSPLKFYPSPTISKVTVLLPVPVSEVETIWLTSLDGKTMYMPVVEKHKYQLELDLSTSKPGYYLVSIRTLEGVFSGMIQKISE